MTDLWLRKEDYAIPDWIVTLDSVIEHAQQVLPPGEPTDPPLHWGLPAVDVLQDLRELLRAGAQILSIDLDDTTGLAGYRCRLRLQTAFALPMFSDDEVVAYDVISASMADHLSETDQLSVLESILPQIAKLRTQFEKGRRTEGS